MTKRLLPAASLVILLNAAWAASCQLLYDKNELTVAAGGGASTSGGGGATSMGGGGTGGGAGGATSTAGAGGVTSGGGATSTGGGGSGGVTMTSGTGGDMDGGTDGDAPTCTGDRVFLVGVSPTSILCGVHSQAAGWSVTTDQSGNSSARPAAILTAPGTGIGVFFEGGATGPLRAVELTNGKCAAPADVPGETTKGPPSAAHLAGAAHVLFQGAFDPTTDHPFHKVYDPANKWGVSTQIDMTIFSPAVAGLAASGASMLAVYGGGNDILYSVKYTGGAFQTTAVSLNEQTDKTITPGVASLDGGGWIIVFKEKTTSVLRWITTDGATGTMSKPIPGALSSSPVALTRIDGGAVLAYRGTDDAVYTAVFDPAGGGQWGSATLISGAKTLTTPAVAAGVCDRRAELAYIDAADGTIKHTSLDGAAWTMPAPIGGAAMKGIAIATAP